jgi:large subunit ribosomal protein L17
MKHHNKTRKVYRSAKARGAMMISLARALVLHEQIETSVAKCKELRPYVEKMVTIAKKNTLASKRAIMSQTKNDAEVTEKLHTVLAPRFMARAGGYTRIVKLGATTNVDHDTAVIGFVA